MTIPAWLETALNSVWEEACDMMEDGGTADVSRHEAAALILQRIEQEKLEAIIQELRVWESDAIDSKPTTYDFAERIKELTAKKRKIEK